LAELQVTVLERSCLLPSLYRPVAVNCCVRPAGTLVDAGVTEIELNVEAEFTVGWVDELLSEPPPQAASNPATPNANQMPKDLSRRSRLDIFSTFLSRLPYKRCILSTSKRW
jgi:hypothetical protein